LGEVYLAYHIINSCMPTTKELLAQFDELEKQRQILLKAQTLIILACQFRDWN
jgi:hypothetical protein